MWKYPCNEKVFVFYQFKSIKPCFRWNAKIVKDWNLKIRNNHLLKKGGNVKEKNYDEHTNEQFRSKFSVWISLKSASFLNNCMYICTQAVYFAYYCCCFYFIVKWVLCHQSMKNLRYMYFKYMSKYITNFQPHSLKRSYFKWKLMNLKLGVLFILILSQISFILF